MLSLKECLDEIEEREMAETEITIWQRAKACIGYTTPDGWTIRGVTDQPKPDSPIGTYVRLVKDGEPYKHVPFLSLEYTSLYKDESPSHDSV